jgi:hypothetical protein
MERVLNTMMYILLSFAVRLLFLTILVQNRTVSIVAHPLIGTANMFTVVTVIDTAAPLLSYYSTLFTM